MFQLAYKFSLNMGFWSIFSLNSTLHMEIRVQHKYKQKSGFPKMAIKSKFKYCKLWATYCWKYLNFNHTIPVADENINLLSKLIYKHKRVAGNQKDMFFNFWYLTTGHIQTAWRCSLTNSDNFQLIFRQDHYNRCTGNNIAII